MVKHQLGATCLRYVSGELGHRTLQLSAYTEKAEIYAQKGAGPGGYRNEGDEFVH